jgi:hypothetical protein
MFEWSMRVSNALNLLLALYLIANAGIAIFRFRNPALKYGRKCLGLVGVGMLCLHVASLFSARMPTLSSRLELAGAAIMVVGVAALIRMFWKYPEVRSRSVNLFGVRE